MAHGSVKATLCITLTLAFICLSTLQGAVAQALIAARGSFYRPISGSYSIANGGNLQFTIMTSESNSAFFSLDPSGSIVVLKTGVYLVMANAPFDGKAQMQFRLGSYAVADTTVGQGVSGELSSFTILTIQAGTLLGWFNPSGHANTVSASLSGSHKSSLVILGLHGVDGSTPVSEYIDLTWKNENWAYNPFWYSTEKKNLIESGYHDEVALAPSGNYLVLYQFAPDDACEIANAFTGHFRSGRATGKTQLVGKFVIKAQGISSVLLTTGGVVHQTKNLGGAAEVYNSMVIISLNGMQSGGFTASGGPYSLASGNRVPLTIGDGLNGLTLNADNSWSCPTGIYLTGVHFNTQAPAMCKVKRGSSDAAGSHMMTPQSAAQLDSVFLMSATSIATNYVELMTAATIDMAGGGPISVFSIRVG